MGGKGSGGHNRKGVEEHLRLGTYRKDRHGDLPEGLVEIKRKLAKQAATVPANEIPANEAVPGGIPKCPEWLDEIAREEWRRVCLHLKELGTLAMADVGVIECYCAAYSRWQKAEKAAQKIGEIYGGKLVLALTQAAKDTLNQLRAYQNDLGLTPKSVVIAPPPQEQESEMAQLLDRVEQGKTI